MLALIAAAALASSCPVTLPNHNPHNAFNHGNGKIGVELWPHGVLRAGRLPSGGYFADIDKAGHVRAKQGWWRVADAKLRIRGHRLGGGGRVRASVSGGYPAGFQPVGLRFPGTGCYRITGRVAGDRLTYVVRVRRA